MSMPAVLRRISLMDLAVLAALVAAALIASQYGARARMVPMVVAIGSIAFLVLQIVLELRGASLDIDQEEALMGEDARRAAEEAEAKEEAAFAEKIRIATYEGGTIAGGILLVASYAALILLVGVVPAVFVFVLYFFLVISRLGFVTSLLLALATEAVIYGLFILTLGVRPNRGFLFDAFL